MLEEFEIEEFIAKYIKNDMILGIGSSKAGEMFLKKIAIKAEDEGLHLKVVPTSHHMAGILSSLNLPIASLNEETSLDLAVEFVDLVDEDFNFVKRESQSLVRDKMIAQCAEILMVVVRKENFVKVTSNSCHFEPGQCAFYDKLPEHLAHT